MDRVHFIDWLRVGAIGALFVYHSLRAFNADGWHVKNAQTSAALTYIRGFFSTFGLALLCLLPGAGARFALRKRTWETFVEDRTARLLGGGFLRRSVASRNPAEGRRAIRRSQGKSVPKTTPPEVSL